MSPIGKLKTGKLPKPKLAMPGYKWNPLTTHALPDPLKPKAEAALRASMPQAIDRAREAARSKRIDMGSLPRPGIERPIQPARGGKPKTPSLARPEALEKLARARGTALQPAAKGAALRPQPKKRGRPKKDMDAQPKADISAGEAGQG